MSITYHFSHIIFILKRTIIDHEWLIKYKGAVDDNGAHPKLANSYISKAVDELLIGQPVSNSETESFGCAIFYRK